MTPLAKEILLKTLRGYKEVNEITEAELRASIPNVTSAESWATFEELYDIWKQTGQKAGGNWEALRAQDLESHIKVQKAFEALARHKGLI